MGTAFCSIGVGDDFDNADWEFGTNGNYLKELCDYWIDGFDWQCNKEPLQEILSR